MIYLLVIFINISMGLLFLYVCIKTIKLLNVKYGILISILSVLGIISFMNILLNHSLKSNQDNNTIKTWAFNNENNIVRNTSHLKTIQIEENYFSSYKTFIKYGRSKYSNELVPICANSVTEGLSVGSIWTPKNIEIKNVSDNHFSYHINGSVTWIVFGIFSIEQPKTYSGDFKVS